MCHIGLDFFSGYIGCLAGMLMCLSSCSMLCLRNLGLLIATALLLCYWICLKVRLLLHNSCFHHRLFVFLSGSSAKLCMLHLSNCSMLCLLHLAGNNHRLLSAALWRWCLMLIRSCLSHTASLTYSEVLCRCSCMMLCSAILTMRCLLMIGRNRRSFGFSAR